MKRTILLIAALVIGATSANAQKFISKDLAPAHDKVAVSTSEISISSKKDANLRKDFVYGTPAMTVKFDDPTQYVIENLPGHTGGTNQGQWRVLDTTAASTTILQSTYPRLYTYFGMATRGYYWFTRLVGGEVGDGFALISPLEVFYADGQVHSKVYNAAIRLTDGFATTEFNTVDVVFNQYTMRFNSDRYFIDYSTSPTFATYDSIEFNVKGIELDANDEAYGQKIVTLPVANSVDKPVLYVRFRYFCNDTENTDLPAGYRWIVDEVNVYNGPEYRMNIISANHVFAAYGVVPQGMPMDTLNFMVSVENTGGKTLYSASVEELTHHATDFEFPNVFGDLVTPSVVFASAPQNFTTDVRVDSINEVGHIRRNIDIMTEGAGAKMYNNQAGLYGLSTGIKYLQSLDSTNYQVIAMEDSIYYRVSEMPAREDAVGTARWASDADVLIEGMAWAYGFEGRYISDNTPSATSAGYEVCTRYITAEDLDIENNAYYAKGVEIVPAADSCDAGLRIQASLKYVDWNETQTQVTDASIATEAYSEPTVINEGLNNGIFTNPDAREFTTNYNSVYLPFTEDSILLYPGQYYYACYKLFDDGRFYVARDDRNFLPTLQTYDWWAELVFSPGAQNPYAWGYFFGDFLSNYNAPMIRLMVSKNPLSIKSVTPTTPSFNLNAYPNPAQNETTIEYSLTSNANVYITVTDIMGREVVRLDEGRKAANTVNRVSLNTNNLNNGTYFYTINVNGVKETKKLVINK